MNKNHKKKMIAPIVVTILLSAYYVIYFAALIPLVSGIWKWVLGITPVAIAAVLIAVCIERINEIKKGEEDDISNY